METQTACCEQWVHFTSHDTALSCQAQRHQETERLDHEMERLQAEIRKAPDAESTKQHAKPQLEIDWAERQAFFAGLCIPADHLYPPKRPTAK